MRTAGLALLVSVALLTACSSGDSVVGGDAGSTQDVPLDAGPLDAGPADTGSMDTGPADTGPLDTGPARCTSAADCAGDADGPACDTTSGRCVPCTPADDRCPSGQYCTAGNACSPGCRDDAACMTAGDAGASAGRCDTSTHQCVQCVTNDHCPPGNLCVGNTCVMGCSPSRPCEAGSTCCDGACVDLQSNTASCGACGTRCSLPNATPACTNGTCTVAMCAAPFADCDVTASNGCETDTSRSTDHCGGCGVACAARPNAAATCAASRCEYACDPGFADCDGDPSNGCEVDTRSDSAHCGMCNRACALPNAAAGCAMGACTVTTCNTGFGDCDGNASNGCEVDTRTAVSHCGTCGNACPAVPNGFPGCLASACVASCVMGFQDCDGDAANGCEVDIRSDASHCGACRRACAPANGTGMCSMGGCAVAACDSGYADCDGDPANGCEANTQTSTAHCGGCGQACAVANATPTCAAGACQVRECGAGFGDCDMSAANGCETNTQTSAAHCGMCGRACAVPNATAACVAGACAVGSCDAGFADCDGNASNGCEVNTQTSNAHCGACGTVCAAGTACASGSCATLPSCAAIRSVSPAAPSGVYRVDPDGGGPGAPFDVYCDMTSDGGGWTLVLVTLPGSALGYSSTSWTTANAFGTPTTLSATVDSKSAGFNTMPVTAMRFCLGSQTACITEPVPAASALAVFMGAERLSARTIADYAVWGYTGNRGCNRRGFNVLDVGGGPARCRYGILLNNESACEGSVDGGRGFGCLGYYGTQVSSGQGDGIVGTSLERGWVWVR